MSAELIFGGLLVGWLLYEAGGKLMLESAQSLYGWTRLLGGIAGIGFLYWHFSAKPETITDSLELAKMMLTSASSSGGRVYGTEKRNVTNLMKKKVAADQRWICAHCQETLDESYEVDHKLALYRGGTNEIENLVALCRNCHGKKTMAERLTPPPS
jgi:hypothetical protein